MAKLRRVAWRPFRIPFGEEFRASHGVMEAREGYVIQVTDTVGHTGLGEASPLPSFAGGSLEETGECIERLARAALRWQATDIVTLTDPKRGYLPERAKLEDATIGSLKPALAGIQAAAADVAGKSSGIPAYRVLNPLPKEPREFAQPVIVPVNAIVGLGEPAEMAEAARQAQDAGFKTLKLKLSDDAELDRARLAAVREVLAPETALRLDANAAWTFEQAKERLAQLAEFAPEFVEQPIPPGEGALEQLRTLQRECGVPLAVDEGVARGPAHEHPAGVFTNTPPYFEAYVHAAVAKPMVVDLDMLRSLVVLALRRRLETVITTTFDTGIGTAYAMHLAALLPEPRPACGLDTLRFLEGDIVTGVPAVEGGLLTLPDRPGLGIELDEAALERCATGPWQEARA